MSDIDKIASETRRKQRIAELTEELSDLEDNSTIERLEPTLYEKSSETIVEKMHNPKTLHDRQIHTNIPRNILTNVMMMGAIEGGLREIYGGEKLEYDKDKKIVNIYRRMPNGEEYIYKTMTFQAYRRAMFYSNAMAGFSGNLLEELMSLDGWRSEQGEREIGSLVRSEDIRQQNKSEVGLVRKALKKII